jgi:hypothetical protein
MGKFERQLVRGLNFYYGLVGIFDALGFRAAARCACENP